MEPSVAKSAMMRTIVMCIPHNIREGHRTYLLDEATNWVREEKLRYGWGAGGCTR